MALKIAVLDMCSGHTSDLKCVEFVVKPPVNYWPVLGGGGNLPEKKRQPSRLDNLWYNNAHTPCCNTPKLATENLSFGILHPSCGILLQTQAALLSTK